MFTDVNVRYETAKRTEAELRQQVLELKKVGDSVNPFFVWIFPLEFCECFQVNCGPEHWRKLVH